ncbi:MAG: TPM domain-containing protein [bacterium]
MKRLIAALFLVVGICGFSPVYAYTSPGNPSGFVNDFAGVLDDTSKQQLEDVLNDLEQQTETQFSVVTIKSLGGDTVENYAHELFTEWGIGKKDTNKGLLLLIAMNERKTRFEVGYGVEGTLTDLLTSRIQRRYLTPKFKAGDYSGGVTDVVAQVSGILRGDVSVEDFQSVTGGYQNPNTAPVSFWSRFTNDYFPFFIYFIFPLGIFFFQFLVYSLAISKSYWLGGAIFGGVGLTLTELFFAMFSTASATSYFKLGTVALVSIISTSIGLVIDYKLSKKGTSGKTFSEFMKSGKSSSGGPGFFNISSGGGSSGRGFGGFGGGSSGGCESSGSW